MRRSRRTRRLLVVLFGLGPRRQQLDMREGVSNLWSSAPARQGAAASDDRRIRAGPRTLNRGAAASAESAGPLQPSPSPRNPRAPAAACPLPAAHLLPAIGRRYFDRPRVAPAVYAAGVGGVGGGGGAGVQGGGGGARRPHRLLRARLRRRRRRRRTVRSRTHRHALALSIIRPPRSLDYLTLSLSRLFYPSLSRLFDPLALSIIRPSCSLDYSTPSLSRLFDTLALSILGASRSLDYSTPSPSRLFDTLALSIIRHPRSLDYSIPSLSRLFDRRLSPVRATNGRFAPPSDPHQYCSVHWSRRFACW